MGVMIAVASSTTHTEPNTSQLAVGDQHIFTAAAVSLFLHRPHEGWVTLQTHGWEEIRVGWMEMSPWA